VEKWLLSRLVLRWKCRFQFSCLWSSPLGELGLMHLMYLIVIPSVRKAVPLCDGVVFWHALARIKGI
jgi:hypothetical protein